LGVSGRGTQSPSRSLHFVGAYLTSPAVNLSAASGSVTLEYWRWLNADFYPYDDSAIEVFDGTVWQNVFYVGINAINGNRGGARLRLQGRSSYGLEPSKYRTTARYGPGRRVAPESASALLVTSMPARAETARADERRFQGFTGKRPMSPSKSRK
jgi:hypothetical protein